MTLVIVAPSGIPERSNPYSVPYHVPFTAPEQLAKFSSSAYAYVGLVKPVRVPSAAYELANTVSGLAIYAVGSGMVMLIAVRVKVLPSVTSWLAFNSWQASSVSALTNA